MKESIVARRKNNSRARTQKKLVAILCKKAPSPLTPDSLMPFPRFFLFSAFIFLEGWGRGGGRGGAICGTGQFNRRRDAPLDAITVDGGAANTQRGQRSARQATAIHQKRPVTLNHSRSPIFAVIFWRGTDRKARRKGQRKGYRLIGGDISSARPDALLLCRRWTMHVIYWRRPPVEIMSNVVAVDCSFTDRMVTSLRRPLAATSTG